MRPGNPERWTPGPGGGGALRGADLMDGAEIDQGEDLGGGIAGILQNAGRELESILRGACARGAPFIGGASLRGGREPLRGDGFQNGGQFRAHGGTLAVTAIAVGDIHTLIGWVRRPFPRLKTSPRCCFPPWRRPRRQRQRGRGGGAADGDGPVFRRGLNGHRPASHALVYAYIAAQAANAAIENNLLGRVAGCSNGR
jgi:hypothetical protein